MSARPLPWLLLPAALAVAACGGDESPAPATHDDAGADSAAGTDSGAGGDAAPLDPTFSNVMAEVFTMTNCGGPLCHTALPGAATSAGGFKLGTPAEVYAELNEPAKGPECGPKPADGGGGGDAGGGDAGEGDAGGSGGSEAPLLVIPGDPEGSLLYQKLTGTQDCGDPMPSGRQPDPAQVQLVHDWIEAGAKQD